MKFTATFNMINTRFGSYTKLVEKQARELHRLAARAYLVAAVNKMPVLTGFLRGAFTPLENLVGYVDEFGTVSRAQNKAVQQIKHKQRLQKRLDNINQKRVDLIKKFEHEEAQLHALQSRGLKIQHQDHYDLTTTEKKVHHFTEIKGKKVEDLSKEAAPTTLHSQIEKHLKKEQSRGAEEAARELSKEGHQIKARQEHIDKLKEPIKIPQDIKAAEDYRAQRTALKGHEARSLDKLPTEGSKLKAALEDYARKRSDLAANKEGRLAYRRVFRDAHYDAQVLKHKLSFENFDQRRTTSASLRPEAKLIKLDVSAKQLQTRLDKIKFRSEDAFKTRRNLERLRSFAARKQAFGGLGGTIAGFKAAGFKVGDKLHLNPQFSKDRSYKIKLTAQGKAEIAARTAGIKQLEGETKAAFLKRKLAVGKQKLTKRAAFLALLKENTNEHGIILTHLGHFERYEHITKTLVSKEEKAFKIWYYHFNRIKVLKTPRSGIQFVTPQDKILQEAEDSKAINPIGAAVNDISVSIGTDGNPQRKFDSVNAALADPKIAKFMNQLTQKAAPRKKKFIFQFQIDIRYYEIIANEHGLLTAGRTAFLEYIKQNVGRLPKLKDFQNIVTIKFDGSKVPEIVKQMIGD